MQNLIYRLIIFSLLFSTCFVSSENYNDHQVKRINEYLDLYDYLEEIYEKIEKECEKKQQTLRELREILDLVDKRILEEGS